MVKLLSSSFKLMECGYLFFRIGKLWVEFLTPDEATSNKTHLFRWGRSRYLQVLLRPLTIHLIWNTTACFFSIRMVEEQVVVNNFMKVVCKCNGCIFARVEGMIQDKEKVENKDVFGEKERFDEFNVQDDQKENEYRAFSIPNEIHSITSPISHVLIFRRCFLRIRGLMLRRKKRASLS